MHPLSYRGFEPKLILARIGFGQFNVLQVCYDIDHDNGLKKIADLS
jgi:hypothetical protein|tara:strand:- start:184 stop:321 length:138 start_codon:yes stop_codon:yes gene_type:complete